MNKRLQKKIDEILPDTDFFNQGNFTIAVVLGGHGGVKAIGVAKRNPNCDEFNAERGREIALAQAAKSLLPKKRERK